jgi:hypothetical protein
VDRVHVSLDRPGALGPPWIDVGEDNGHGGALTGARPPAAQVRRSSPVGAQNGEEGTGSSIRASPGLERRRGGRVTTGKARWCRLSHPVFKTQNQMLIVCMPRIKLSYIRSECNHRIPMSLLYRILLQKIYYKSRKD